MPGALRKDVISEMGFVLPVKMLGSTVVSTSLNQKLNTFFEDCPGAVMIPASLPFQNFQWKTDVILSCYCGGLVTKLCSSLATTWTIDHQVPQSMRFSRQEYWSG